MNFLKTPLTEDHSVIIFAEEFFDRVLPYYEKILNLSSNTLKISDFQESYTFRYVYTLNKHYNIFLVVVQGLSLPDHTIFVIKKKIRTTQLNEFTNFDNIYNKYSDKIKNVILFEYTKGGCNKSGNMCEQRYEKFPLIKQRLNLYFSNPKIKIDNILVFNSDIQNLSQTWTKSFQRQNLLGINILYNDKIYRKIGDAKTQIKRKSQQDFIELLQNNVTQIAIDKKKLQIKISTNIYKPQNQMSDPQIGYLCQVLSLCHIKYPTYKYLVKQKEDIKYEPYRKPNEDKLVKLIRGLNLNLTLYVQIGNEKSQLIFTNKSKNEDEFKKYLQQISETKIFDFQQYSEKVVSIKHYIDILKYNRSKVIFTNHAGSEKSYFTTLQNQMIQLPKSFKLPDQINYYENKKMIEFVEAKNIQTYKSALIKEKCINKLSQNEPKHQEMLNFINQYYPEHKIQYTLLLPNDEHFKNNIQNHHILNKHYHYVLFL